MNLLKVKRSLMSGDSRITISSIELAWRTGLKPGVSFAYAFAVLPNTEEGFLVSVGFTSSANDLPAVLATSIAFVMSSTTEKIENAVSKELSDMLGLVKNMNLILTQ